MMMKGSVLLLTLMLVACGSGSNPIGGETPRNPVPANDTSQLPSPDSRDFAYLENLDASGAEVVSDPFDLSNILAPEEFFNSFRVHIIVNKAAKGPTAQTMRVFVPEEGSEPKFTWLVSTGREKFEKAPSGKKYVTSTPTGVFLLDHKRLFKKYSSRLWANAPMPYAMFFKNPNRRGTMSGLAIHGIAKSKEAHLGTRASGGCVRLATANAETLFNFIKPEMYGEIPMFDLANTSSGLFVNVWSKDNEILKEEGYSVLVRIIDDPVN